MNGRLFDAVSALDDCRAQRDQGQPDLFTTITAVMESAGEVWKLEVLEAIVTIARRKPTLTVEGLDGLIPPTLDLRALGGVMLEAQRRGYIRKGGWVNSGRERHGRPVREWHSRVFAGGASLWG